ncbi:MAG: methionyl-tRNA formyltransferase [Chitinophagaceae bacterium]|nr:methionyl-tRNA formyltransferase [Chitinophagaceae bacterium]
MRIIFLGTPDFAVASLKALVDNKFNVVAVVTAPDKPAGRGMKLQASAVKQYAVEQAIPVLQPEKLKSPEFLETLKQYHADLQVVVAFRMLPEVVWNMPPLGTINVHASLLPNYRGAAPIHWAIMNGEKESGVTTFKLKHEIDTGNILLQQSVAIGEEETTAELYQRLMHVGATLLIETIKQVENGSLQEKPQSNLAQLHHAPKITKETCLIEWNRKGIEIKNKIRGLNPSPAAYTLLDGKILKIYRATFEETPHKLTPGELQTDNKTYLKFATNDGWLFVLEIQLEGKSKMNIQDFLRGYSVSAKTSS